MNSYKFQVFRILNSINCKFKLLYIQWFESTWCNICTVLKLWTGTTKFYIYSALGRCALFKLIPCTRALKVTVDVRGVFLGNNIVPCVLMVNIYKPIYHWRAYITGYTSVASYMRSFRYESNRNRLFYKTVSRNFEIFILHRFKVFFASLFGLSLTERSKIAIIF